MQKKLQILLDKHSSKVYTIGNTEENIEAAKKEIISGLDVTVSISYRDLFGELVETLQSSREQFQKAWEEIEGDKYFPNRPVFAGGFFRDCILNQYPNDLDLFINTHGMDKQDVEDLASLFVTSIEKQDCPISLLENSSYAFHKSCMYVFNVEHINLFAPVQLIFKDLGEITDNPLDYVKDFDYSLVMIASPLMSEEIELHFSAEAVSSFKEKTNIWFLETAKDRSLYKGLDAFKVLDLTKNKATTVLELKKQKDKERQKHLDDLKKYNEFTMPLREVF